MHRISNQWKLASETTTFGWMQPSVPLIQLNCSILWSTISEQPINIFDFLDGDNYQGKVASYITTFGWV